VRTARASEILDNHPTPPRAGEASGNRRVQALKSEVEKKLDTKNGEVESKAEEKLKNLLGK